jgi:Xaa-Pro dipeptidase
MHLNRRQQVAQKMQQEGVGHLILSDPSTIFYLTGTWFHPGERLIVLHMKADASLRIVINELFPLNVDLGAEVVWYNDTQDGIEYLAKGINDGQVIGVDKFWAAHFLLRLMEKKPNFKYVNGSMLVDRVRMRKDTAEKEFMRKASLLNDEAMAKISARVKDGLTELEMVKALSDIYEEIGTDGFSFGPIIAYGANGADPHHDCDGSLVKTGDSIIIDIGCKKDNYCSDMTRTFFFGEPSAKSREVYEVVKEANLRAIAKVKPGVKFSEIDLAARDYIESKGYGQYFTHRTGHSIGIDVHDFGDVSSVNHDEVAEGMIFSIEPGIYLAGEVGVRIEDLVLVTETGCEVLNHYSKDLIVL